MWSFYAVSTNFIKSTCQSLSIMKHRFLICTLLIFVLLFSLKSLFVIKVHKSASRKLPSCASLIVHINKPLFLSKRPEKIFMQLPYIDYDVKQNMWQMFLHSSLSLNSTLLQAVLRREFIFWFSGAPLQDFQWQ